MTPLIQAMTTQTTQSTQQQGELFNLNFAEAQQANQRYQQYGIPAENAYYNMVKNYSAPSYEEQVAQQAIGDVRAADATQSAQLGRQLQSLGINPTSPAAIAARSDATVMNVANQAGAATQARNAARALGMQLTSDAANFGRGGTSQTLAFGANASGNTNSAASIAQGGVGAGVQGAQVPLQAYAGAMNAYNGILDAYSRLGSADIQANAQSGAGFGNFLGTIGAAAIKAWG